MKLENFLRKGIKKQVNKHVIINILDMLKSLGEDEVRSILSDFSCPKNSEIEDFLHNNAIDFAKRKISITYLVFNECQHLVGYFTLTHKTSVINNDSLSNTSRKKLATHAKFDDTTNSYYVSAFLIAQFGKNYIVNEGTTISGTHLMDYAFDTLCKIQHLVGGGVIFLECEDKEKLVEFYQNDNNRFKQYNERYSEKDHKKYLQMLRFF